MDRALLLLLVAVLSFTAAACGYQADVFCEDAECDDLLVRESFMCGQSFCVDFIDDGYCVARFTCTETGTCAAAEIMPGYSDDPCLINHCENGEWVQEPRDVDDGDPCTIDECEGGIGPTHTKIC